jgi:hypothetical protein
MEAAFVLWAVAALALVCLLGGAFFARVSSKNASAAARFCEEAVRIRQEIEGLMKRHSELAVEITGHTEKALAIAELSAKAAQDGISAVKTLADISERAYIGFDSLDVAQRDPASGMPAVVRAAVRNAGKTPARSVITCQWVRHLKDFPAEPEYPGIETVTGAVLGPGSGERVDASGPRLDAATALDVKRRKLTIFAYGICRYEDLFGNNHQTRWAFYWNVERQQFLRCPRHNDMN